MQTPGASLLQHVLIEEVPLEDTSIIGSEPLHRSWPFVLFMSVGFLGLLITWFLAVQPSSRR